MTLNNIDDLLTFTNCSKKQLDFLAFGKNTTNNKLYKRYVIPKNSGKIRVIHEPTLKLKIIQRRILNNLLESYWKENVNFNIKKSVTGFCKGKSIIDNASLHLNKKVILKFDLKNFFPSISQNRIFGMFSKRFGFNYNISSYLSGLCSFEDELPQGAPTSPLIANILSLNLDSRIIAYIKKIKQNEKIDINYTRYADDISISINSNDTFILEFISKRIFSIIEEEGFMVNYSKYRILKNNKQQKITGLIVNDKVSLGRSNFKELKAIVFNINKNGRRREYKSWKEYGNEAKSLKNFQSIIKGKIAYYYMVNKNSYGKHLELKR